MLCIEECGVSAHPLTSLFHNWKLFLQVGKMCNVLLIQHVGLYSQIQLVNRHNQLFELHNLVLSLIHQVMLCIIKWVLILMACLIIVVFMEQTLLREVFIWLFAELLVHYVLHQNLVMHYYVIFGTAKMPMLDTLTKLENTGRIIMMI